jgi:hypothetical protein
MAVDQPVSHLRIERVLMFSSTGIKVCVLRKTKAMSDDPNRANDVHSSPSRASSINGASDQPETNVPFIVRKPS